MDVEQLERAVESLRASLTPEFVRVQVDVLLGQGEDVGGGVNAFRLIRHLLGKAAASEEQITWAYERLKRDLGAALEQVPSLYYFQGD